MMPVVDVSVPQDTGRKLILTMSADGDGNVLLSSCEVAGRGFRNRTKWAQPMELHAVLQPELASFVQDCMSNLSGKNEIISMSERAFEKPGLLLRNAHLLANGDQELGFSIILRFKTFLGSLSSVFQPKIDLVNGIHDATMDMADRILLDIAMPLLNFLSLDEEGALLGKDDAQRLVAQLTNQSHALTFQIELIKRHMARLEAAKKVPMIGKVAFEDDTLGEYIAAFKRD